MGTKSLRLGARWKTRATRSVIERLENRLFLAAQSITSLTLINADTQQAITGFNPIPAGATLNFATLGTKDLNILVNTSPVTVGSVGFNYDGNAKYHIENTAPYDIGGDTNGVYAAWTPALGTHTLIVTPYSGSNLSGTAGTSLSETFTVTNTTTTTESPFLGTPFAVPGTIMADNFDNGGQGVAYNDTTAGNQGGSYRSTDVDIEPTSDTTPPGLTSTSPGVGFDVGHIVASEWLKYTINVATAGTFAFDVRVASAVNGGTFHIESDGVNVTGAMSLTNTGGWQTWQTVTASNISLTAGQHILRLVFDTSNSPEMGNVGYINVRSLTTTPPPPTETPFLGSPFAVPGTIMLDNFDNGGQGIAYNDTTAGNQGGSYRSTDVDIEPATDSVPPGLTSTSPGVGFNIGHIVASEWLKYTINVATAGTFDFDVCIANAGPGGIFHIESDGVNVTGSMSLSNTGGWETWQTISASNISLTAGQHVLRLVFDTTNGGELGNVYYLDIRSTTTTPPPPTETPFLGSPLALPGTIMLDNFDIGGQGVAYNDTTPGNQGGSYRSTDVDIESATDSTPPGLTSTSPGVGFNVGNIQTGEWLNCTVSVASNGAYNFGVRVASLQGGLFHISIDGSNVSGSLTLPNTGGWQTWQTVTVPGVTLPAGQHILQISFDSSAFSEFGNIEYLQVTPASSSITTSPVTWASIAPSPIARDEGQSISINNLLYAFGGFDDPSYDSSNRSDVYNMATNTWTQLANMPSTITHAGTIYDSVNNNIWLIGGFTGPENAPAITNVWIYSITNNSWSAGPSLPSAVGAPAVTLVGRNVHVISGLNEVGTTFMNTTEHWVMSLDNQAVGWTSAAPLPTPRNHAGCVTLNGLIYVIGGQDVLNETGGNMAAVEAYNPTTNTWATEAPLPAGRGHIMNSTLVRNGQILVVGGETNGSPFRSDVLLYDPGTNTWSTLNNVTLPQGRKAPVAGMFGDLLVVFGGQNPNPDPDGWEGTLSPNWQIGAPLPVSLGEVAAGVIGTNLYVVGQESATTYVYNLTAGTWSTAAPRPDVGDHHAAEVVNGKLYLIGGLDNGSPGQVQIYNPATNSWSLGAPMPYSGGSVSTALINGKIYAAGGIINSTTTTNQAAVYDPVANTWTSIASMPMGVNHAAASTDGSKLYIFGGRTGGNVLSTGFNEVEIYNPSTNTWTSSTTAGSTLAPLPQARGGMGKAVFFNGEFYVLGGETSDPTVPNGVYNRVDIYNPVTNTWRLGTPMPNARHGIFPVLYNGEIYIAGGGVHSDDSNSTLLEIYTNPGS